MRTTTITCDSCSADLTATGNCQDYRIIVDAEGIPSKGGAVTAMHIPRPVERAYHFCGLGCLAKWPALR